MQDDLPYDPGHARRLNRLEYVMPDHPRLARELYWILAEVERRTGVVPRIESMTNWYCGPISLWTVRLSAASGLMIWLACRHDPYRDTVSVDTPEAWLADRERCTANIIDWIVTQLLLAGP